MGQSAPIYTGFVKAVSFAIKQFRLYSEKHPITQQALQTLALEIQKFFKHEAAISFGAMSHHLVVNGEAAGDKDTFANDLANELERLAIDGVSLERGIEIDEMKAFLILMTTRTKTLEEKGGFRKLFEEHSFPHVSLSTGKFQLVEEGQAITTGAASEIAKEAKKSSLSIADIIHRIREEKTGAGVKTPLLIDSEKVVHQIEKNPAEIARAALEGIGDPKKIESVLRKVIHSLVESLVSYLVEQGKDITKALEKLAKELVKSIEKMGDGDEIKKLKERVPDIFEEVSDELRIQMMMKTHQKNPEDVKALQKIAEKIFKDESIRKRLGPSLKEEMVKSGLSAVQIEAIFDKIEEKEEKKKSKLTIDADELAELRRKAEQFDVEFEKRIQKTLEKFEREKKVLLDEKERVDSVIRHLAEGLLVVDKNGKVVLMNPAAERMLGVKQSEKIGKPVAEGLKEEHLVAMTGGANLRDSEGQVAKQVEVVSLNDETKRVLQASTAVVENEDGQTVGMVSVLSDVTKQKELEELKTKFVAHVSHEFRTPLVSIQKSISLIIGKELGEVSPEQQKYLEIANRNMERLSRLVNDLLDLSKLEAGKMELRIKEIWIQELVKQVFLTVETLARGKQIKLETRFTNNSMRIEGDSDRLTQVLTNLVGNAVKYTPDGGTITVDGQSNIKDSAIPSGPCIEIGVRDTGIGISPEDQKKIFDKFVQVSLAQPAGFSSTGLGLTIAKEIVDMHGGRIWVESEALKGSRFAFRIPVQPPPRKKEE